MGLDNISKIRNKIKRQDVYRGSKIEKAKAKLTQRKERAQAEKLDPKLKEVKRLFNALTYMVGAIEDKYPSYS